VKTIPMFVVKHYASEERPMIKGNGFDGLEIGDDREEAEVFVAWVNNKLRELNERRAYMDPDK
jgi:hypothetical protein